jgi:hypothetical protein
MYDAALKVFSWVILYSLIPRLLLFSKIIPQLTLPFILGRVLLSELRLRLER